MPCALRLTPSLQAYYVFASILASMTQTGGEANVALSPCRTMANLHEQLSGSSWLGPPSRALC